MRYGCLLMTLLLVGCQGRDSSPREDSDAPSDHPEAVVSIAPAPSMPLEDKAIPSDMDVLPGVMKTDTSILTTMDASSLVDDIIGAIEDNNRKSLTQYEKMGWILSIPAGTRLVVLHADDYPYLRIQLEDEAYERRRGYVHKKYLVLDEKGLNLRRFTSSRGGGTAWRSL